MCPNEERARVCVHMRARHWLVEFSSNVVTRAEHLVDVQSKCHCDQCGAVGVAFHICLWRRIDATPLRRILTGNRREHCHCLRHALQHVGNASVISKSCTHSFHSVDVSNVVLADQAWLKWITIILINIDGNYPAEPPASPIFSAMFRF